MVHSQQTQFLRQCARRQAQLRTWIMDSVARMDALVSRGFPVLFGAGWREKMMGMTTPEKTKLLTYICDHSLELVANEQEVRYSRASVDDVNETQGFDALLFNCQLENKLTLSADPASFGTGNRNTVASKGDRVLTIKLQHDGVRTHGVFAAIIDLTHAANPMTGWASAATTGRPRDSFATLKIHNDDEELIIPVCGNIRLGRTYVRAVYGPPANLGGERR